MSRGLARVRETLTKNKVALGVLGAAAVAALAWRARSSTSSGSATTTTPAGVSPTPAYYSTGAQTGSATGYDSTASDVYNAIQPQLEDLRDLIGKAQSPIPVPIVDDEPAPPPEPTAQPTPVADQRRSGIVGFYRTILGRDAGNLEVNYWDATGQSLDQIRQGIVNSPEAQGR